MNINKINLIDIRAMTREKLINYIVEIRMEFKEMNKKMKTIKEIAMCSHNLK